MIAIVLKYKMVFLQSRISGVVINLSLKINNILPTKSKLQEFIYLANKLVEIFV